MITCFARADKRRTKNKCKKTFTCFLLTKAQRLIIAPIAVTYKNKGGGEKGESYMVDIK
jgi:hypothetical protein